MNPYEAIDDLDQCLKEIPRIMWKCKFCHTISNVPIENHCLICAAKIYEHDRHFWDIEKIER